MPSSTNKQAQNEFMEYVQLHERSWGNATYPGRPNLTDILNTPVVVFWAVESKDERYQVTLHLDLREIEKHFYQMLFRAQLKSPRRRPVRIFEYQRRMIVKDVRILFAPHDEAKSG